MFLLAHMGIPLGAIWLPQRATLASSYLQKRWGAREGPASTISGPARDRPPLASFTGRVDYRLILLGSLLPDTIDKPVGLLILRDFFSNGRIFGHSFLFSLLILAAGG